MGNIVVFPHIGSGNHVCETILGSVLEHYSAFEEGYPWNKNWRKASVSNLERFDEDLYYFEDFEWVIRMLIKIKRVCICAESLYVHYNNSDSVSNQKEKERFRKLGYHHSINKVIDDIEMLPAVLQKYEKKYYIEVINGNNWSHKKYTICFVEVSYE